VRRVMGGWGMECGKWGDKQVDYRPKCVDGSRLFFAFH
jgi:hypothetical protein